MVWLFMSALIFSVNNILWKIALEKMPPLAVMAMRAMMTTLVALLLLLFFFTEYSTRVVEFLPVLWGPSLGAAFGLTFMLLGLQRGNLRQLSVYALVGILFTATYLVLVEGISLEYYGLGALLILFGYVLYIWRFERGGLRGQSGLAHLFFAGMILCFSASYLLHWHNFRSEVPVVMGMLAQEGAVLTTALVLMSRVGIRGMRMQFSQALPHFGHILLMATLVAMAVYFGFLGLAATDPLIAALSTLSVSLLTVLWDKLFRGGIADYSLILILGILSFGYVLLAWQLNMTGS